MKFLIVNIIISLIQAIIFYACYSTMFFGLDGTYLHAGYLFILFIILILYFIPTYIAAFMNKKYFLQIFLLNLFAGFTFIGWLGALIWATFKSEDEIKTGLAASIIMQIFIFLSFLGFCIYDYQNFNYEKVDHKQQAEIQQFLDAVNTIKNQY